MHEPVKSRKNRMVTHLRALRQKKYRDEAGEFLIEGAKVVGEALALDVPVVSILVRESYCIPREISAAIQSKNIALTVFADDVFDAMAPTCSPQGILALCRQYHDRLPVFSEDAGFYVYCDQVADPGNLGAILRSAAAFCASGVILSKECVDLYNEKVLRAAMGALFRVPVFKSRDDTEILALLEKQGIALWATALTAQETIRETAQNGSVCIVLGNEANGICERVLTRCERFVKIPMPGGTESLNVSVAAGIFMYELSDKFGLL